MSFCVDLWNGFDIIKEKFTKTHKKIKAFKKFVSSYIDYETEHCDNLDLLYKEYKDVGNIDYPLQNSRINLINMINFESTKRREFITFINKNILEKMSLHLSEPKISLDQRFLDNIELTNNFRKTLEKLIAKQETFHYQCKELCSYISEMELGNNMNNKAYISKCQKILNKVIKTRDEYLLYINETNIDRKKYNLQIEGLLNELEKTYKKAIERFKDYLSNFAEQKYLFLKTLYEKEQSDYEKCHSNIDLKKEALLFIMNNATKEFPMVKIEFCSFKQKDMGKFIRSKYKESLNDKDYNRVIKAIQTYFQDHNVLPDNILQTGISKISPSKNQFDFFSSRRFTKPKERIHILDKKRLDTIEDKIKDKTPEEKEMIILENVNFIKNFLMQLITDGKVKMFDYKLRNDDNIFRFENETKDSRENMSTDQKVSELFFLINISNESCEVYIETLIKTLSYIRSKGYYEINKFNYNLLQLIFIRILEEHPKNDYMLKNILILSQTFYNLIDDEKIYLQKGIKGNEVLNCPETWHRCINYTIALANSEKDLTIPIKKNELIYKINKEASVNVIPYLCDIKIFTNEQYTFDKVKYFYSYIYNLDNNEIDQNVEDYLKNFNKKLNSNQKKNNNINEIKVNVKIKDKKSEKISEETKGEVKEETKGETKEETKGETKEETKGETKEETKEEKKEETKGETKKEKESDIKNEIKE